MALHYLPYYRQQQASERVQAMLEAQTQPVLISHLTEVEVASALVRWVRMGSVTITTETPQHRVNGDGDGGQGFSPLPPLGARPV